MRLLKPTPPAELPADALLARLRCRRAAITAVSGPAQPALAGDLVCWVYPRLESGLRKQLEPFLDLLAMRDLILILRYRLAGENPPAMLANDCLLAEPLRRLATMPGDPQTTLARIEAALAGDYPFAVGLAATCRSQGPGGMEQQLSDGILRNSLAHTGEHALRTTLRYLVDMRNCLMIHKLWRWQVNRKPPLTAGGALATTRLLQIWATRDSDRLNRLIAQLAGEGPSSTRPVAVEQSLLKGLTRLLRRLGRDPLGPGVIIDTLWRAHLVLHDQALRQALSADRDPLLAEVLLS